MALLSLFEEAQEGGAVPSCMYLLGVMGAVVLSLVGVILKLAKVAWEERMGRITDREAMRSEALAMLKATNERKGGG